MRRANGQGRQLHNSDQQLIHDRSEEYNKGYKEGYQDGQQAGIESYGEIFEGISIIMPVCNELSSLRKCMSHLEEQVELPYEIIVVDYSSTDEVAAFLTKLEGKARYVRCTSAGTYTAAANRGLMMAKGSMMLLLSIEFLLSNDSLKTMIACLNSDNRAGMVGPVSNGLLGDQYSEPRINHHAGESTTESVSSESYWQKTDRLSGECLLLKRKVLEQIGYFDEGCQGSELYEDDFAKRVSLLGYNLFLARNAYIQRAGFKMHRNSNNWSFAAEYYADKWGEKLINLISNGLEESKAPRSARQYIEASNETMHESLGESFFYPQGVVVKGPGPALYWIENGMRNPIEGETNAHWIRISQLDLLRWPLGSTIAGEQLSEEYRKKAIGLIYRRANGSLYQMMAGMKRCILSPYVAVRWGLTAYIIEAGTEDWLSLPDGPPIIAPALIGQSL